MCAQGASAWEGLSAIQLPPRRPDLQSAFHVRPLHAAFGGQFAFLELLTSMRTPSQFTGSVVACTAIMTAMYGGLGAVGYGSKGSSIHGIAVFNMTPGRAAQIAAAFIFIQVTITEKANERLSLQVVMEQRWYAAQDLLNMCSFYGSANSCASLSWWAGMRARAPATYQGTSPRAQAVCMAQA